MQAEAISTLVQTTVATVLGPLVAELAASRQTVERQADQLVGLAEQIGRLTAENANLRDSHSAPAWRGAPWGLWAVMGAMTLLVVVLLLAGAVGWLR